MDYWIIKNEVSHSDGYSYTELITAVLTDNGFKRILNLRDFLSGQDVILDREELIEKSMDLLKINRGGVRIKIDRF